MNLGMAGLGKMGANMARRLRRGGIEVTAFNRSAGVTDGLAAEVGIVTELQPAGAGRIPAVSLASCG